MFVDTGAGDTVSNTDKGLVEAEGTGERETVGDITYYFRKGDFQHLDNDL